MARYFIELAYNGTNYIGWQIQHNGIAVQEKINTAFSTILKTPIEVVGAGRTDTGVHASQQFAHFDIEQELPFELDVIIYKCNAFLPKDIFIRNIFRVKDTAHTRFDATERTYHYFIAFEKQIFHQDTVVYVKHSLDFNLMNKACSILMKYNDFASFCKSNSDNKTTLCNVTKAEWVETENGGYFTITANRFLRNMVRSIVGTMFDIGRNKISLADFQSIIEQKDRKVAGASVPGHGLFLSAIKYPDDIYFQ